LTQKDYEEEKGGVLTLLSTAQAGCGHPCKPCGVKHMTWWLVILAIGLSAFALYRGTSILDKNPALQNNSVHLFDDMCYAV
jgi:hypothetical protein